MRVVVALCSEAVIGLDSPDPPAEFLAKLGNELTRQRVELSQLLLAQLSNIRVVVHDETEMVPVFDGLPEFGFQDGCRGLAWLESPRPAARDRARPLQSSHLHFCLLAVIAGCERHKYIRAR